MVTEDKHWLTAIDIPKRLAICSICGPIDIRKDGDKWACGPRMRATRNRHWHERRTPEQIALEKTRMNNWRESNQEIIWEQHLMRRYQMTREDYDRILYKQKGGCAICGTTIPGRRRHFDVDHNHSCCPGTTSCGKCVRGLLCEAHNRGLGIFGDNPELFIKTASYLSLSR